MQGQITAAEALDRLKQGNARYAGGLRSVEAMTTVLLRKELVEKGQSPFAIILACSDSRAPAEILFDQGLGDLFVIRVAGNVLAPSLLASIEFAASTFRTQLCVVMGHTQCGAITAAIEHFKSGQPMPSDNLQELVARILPSVESSVASAAQVEPSKLTFLVTHSHVTRTAKQVFSQSPILIGLKETGSFRVVEAVYDLATGKVDFHDD